jgi:hypothetical protein
MHSFGSPNSIDPLSIDSLTSVPFWKKFLPLNLLRFWLESWKIRDPKVARRLCKVIPANCPFERDVQVFGWLFHIPAMCKLNPVYEQLVGLRFRALSFLADECGEDVTPYCQ